MDDESRIVARLALVRRSAYNGSVPELTPGSEFAGYTIEDLAGRGGMGVVYRARQHRPSRLVALKVIAPDLAGDADFRARFERESDTAASIEHPNVIPVYEVNDVDGLLFIAMRFVEGTDLRAMIAESGRLAPELAADLTGQITSALDPRGPRRPPRRRPRPPRRDARQRPGRRQAGQLPRVSHRLRPDEERAGRDRHD